MSVGVTLFLVLIILCRDSHQMWCLDGSDCETSDTCSLCEGAACLRVQSSGKTLCSLKFSCSKTVFSEINLAEASQLL
ncbi:hypothetical protein B9Z55_019305 [Caenorhabditis nigoni]|uniref:Uncharacterized protein n=1 Tax=Caenorhabditis nigoni TaxID=1611254 RepID=A0A2G5THS0_9PELO|nr:hypothetical protein B9Z55_019305 [Caenorhabditis nigoni]